MSKVYPKFVKSSISQEKRTGRFNFKDFWHFEPTIASANIPKALFPYISYTLLLFLFVYRLIKPPYRLKNLSICIASNNRNRCPEILDGNFGILELQLTMLQKAICQCGLSFLNLMFSRLSRMIVGIITRGSFLLDSSWALKCEKLRFHTSGYFSRLHEHATSNALLD